MIKVTSFLVGLFLISGLAVAEPVLDEETVRGISAELMTAAKSNDVSVFKKYLYPGSKIVIDTDPSPSAGQVEINYDQYMGLLEMSLALLADADIQDETISVSVNEAKNQATIKEKTSVAMTMMGTTVRDVSISETTYGVVDGQIKVLLATDELLISEVIE